MKNLRNKLRVFALSLGMLILILDTKTALQGAEEGIRLCVRCVIPSLFPLLVLSILLTQSLSFPDKIGLLSRILGIPRGSEGILLTGLIGGYPVGAQSIAIAHQNGSLSRRQGHRMLGFCSNAGPAFLFGMCGPLFTKPWIPWLLWGIHILSALLTGFLLPEKDAGEAKVIPGKSYPLSLIMNQAVKTMGAICGWIVLMRIVLVILKRWILWLLPQHIQVFITACLEIANGCQALEQIPDEGNRFLLCAWMLGFGGLCVWMQTVSVVGELGTGMYVPGKLIQGSLSGILAAIAGSLIYSTSLRPGIVILCIGIAACSRLWISLSAHKKGIAKKPIMLYNKEKREKRMSNAVS